MYKNILDLIGDTPLINLKNILNKKSVNIYAKLESTNPGGSIKDRVALNMIEEAESNEQLDKNKTILEASSGNTAIGLSLVAKYKGYNFTAIMSEGVSKERKNILDSYGTNIITTSKNMGTDGAILKVKSLLEKHPEKYFNPDQFNNNNNVNAHIKTTAKEIWKDMNGNIDYFITGIGTGGTITGVGKYLKKKDKSIKIIALHPEKDHNIYGLKNLDQSIIPSIIDKSVIDHIMEVKTDQAINYKNILLEKEGIFTGYSSGANIFGAISLAKNIKSGNIVTILPDSGNRYLSVG